ncbi:MAG: hypothetical protein KKC55_14800 [Gammaproteobacteria bacterium]|uniref:Uncharacterized protein n=1 Tax=viral metagenome TaxID=1070528 RepID=A0A6H1ZVH9_9ZZZZ|nr:hypothetical protein [Gammaproteobacteria bacterium]
MATVVYSFSLDDKKHLALKMWLDSLTKQQRSGAIRDILAAHLNGHVTLRDVYQKLSAIERKLGKGIVVAMENETSRVVNDEPPDIAATLDRLGKNE